MQDGLKISGEVEFLLTASDGTVKEHFTTKNAVVTNGTYFIASRMKDATATVMSHMALGSNNTAVAPAQNDVLGLLGSREAIDSTTVTNNTVKYTAAFEAGDATGTIQEAGIFNAASAGTMLCRTVFNPINKDTLDTLTVNWTITINAA
jgi:hypothetical protein